MNETEFLTAFNSAAGAYNTKWGRIEHPPFCREASSWLNQ